MNCTVFHSQWGLIRTINLNFITTTTTISYARFSATWESSWQGLTVDGYNYHQVKKNTYSNSFCRSMC